MRARSLALCERLRLKMLKLERELSWGHLYMLLLKCLMETMRADSPTSGLWAA